MENKSGYNGNGYVANGSVPVGSPLPMVYRTQAVQDAKAISTTSWDLV